MLNTHPGKIVKHSLICLVLFGITVGIYNPVLRAEFLHWDDRAHVTENQAVFAPLDRDGLTKIFSQKINGNYIPLTTMSFALDYRLWGDSARGLHATNVVLHFLNVLLVYALALRLGLTMWSACLAAALFAFHPVRVEAIAWISQRKELLYSFFFLGGMICYDVRLRALQLSRGRFNQWLALLAVHGLGVLSILAHPMALGFPLVLLLLDWFRGRRINRAVVFEKVPLALCLAAVAYATFTGHVRGAGVSQPQAMMVAGWSCVFFLRQYVLPIAMVPIIRLPEPIAWANPQYMFSFITFLIVVACGWRLRKIRWIMFATGFFCCSMLFLILFGATKILNLTSERVMYLPGLGFALALAYGVQWIGSRSMRRSWSIKIFHFLGGLSLFVLVLLMGVATYRQTFVWQNDVSLWRHQLTHDPEEPIALIGLADALREKEEFQQAEAGYRQMVAVIAQGYELKIDPAARERIRRVHYILGLMHRAKRVAPGLADIPYTLGRYYQDLGLYSNAVAEYRDAVAVAPDFKDVYAGLGRIYLEIKDLDKAGLAFQQYYELPPTKEEDYLKVVEIYSRYLIKDPDNIALRSGMFEVVAAYVDYVNHHSPGAQSYVNLGLIYIRTGDTMLARQAFERSLELNPRTISALYALGMIHLEEGRPQAALDNFNKVVALDKKHADAWVQIGNILYSQGDVVQARAHYQQAIARSPQNAQAHFNLGYTYEEAGELASAVSQYQTALQHDPRNPEVHFNLGNVYLKQDHLDEAIEEYLKTVTQNPDHRDAWVNLAITSYNVGDKRQAKEYYEEAVLLGFDPTPEMLRQFGAIR